MKKGLYLFFVLTMFSSHFPMEAEVLLQGALTPTTSISMVGDIFMDGSVKSYIDKNGGDYPWEMVKEYFQNDDVTIGNLETSITTKDTKWPEKTYNFRGDPKNLKFMKEAGVDVVALGNNHSLDYGYEGFLDTLNHLDKSEIKRVGGGKNKKEAIEGIILDKNDIKIGILSFSRVVPSVDWYATSKRPGIVGAYDGHIKDVLERVREIKEEVDILVLSIHWGVEGSTTPRKEEIALAKKLIDGGVDIIMGHHPHVLQGIEIYNGKPIFYSLGNFIFGSKDGLTSNTMIAQVSLTGKNIDSIQIIPCVIIKGRPVPVEKEQWEEKIKYINSISKDFNTNIDKDGKIKILQ